MGLYGTGATSVGGLWQAPFGVHGETFKPFTIMCWAKDTTTTNFNTYATYGGFGSGASGTTSANAVVRTVGSAANLDENNDSSVEGVASISLPAMGANTWAPFVAVASSATMRTIYAQNGMVGSNTASITPQTFNAVILGANWTQVNGVYQACPTTQAMAEFAIWRAALGPSEVALLQAGISPLRVRPEALFCYFPLYSDLSDVGPLRLKLNGPAPQWTDHPLVARCRPLSARWLRAGTAAATVLVGPRAIWFD